ncbi:hypothetical protein [Streptomyces europaeiscabiei]|uniref:hypothetical protein n=1 Tax=Streptomyces europaeiscabiei TaxID=146819 RepID=UPI0029A6DB05|nr:hypothetical protein [Streptomyces europaeiscabiei]MDX2767015.1 hypothetical protein [Streptomyces europaeiscabiei]
MSAATPDRGVSAQNAQRALDAAEEEVRSIPVGEIKTDVLLAHSAKAQVFTNAAIVHALLEIGDVLRAAFRERTDG